MQPGRADRSGTPSALFPSTPSSASLSSGTSAPAAIATRAAPFSDLEDDQVDRAELWTEDGKFKVRGYTGPIFKTQTTWIK
jgi:hypothetical protein